MNRRNLIWILLLPIVAVAAFFLNRMGRDMPETDNFSEVITRIVHGEEEQLSTQTPREGPVRLALGPLGGGNATQDAEIADMVLALISDEKAVELVERHDLSRIFNEVELGYAGAVRPETAVRLGELVGADWFLLGTRHRGDAATWRLFRLVDAGSGRMLNVLVLPDATDPIETAQQLGGLVRDTLGTSTEAQTRPDYVSIGGFQDVGVWRGDASFETDLKSHLARALSESGYAPLEHELTQLLLEESRMAAHGMSVGRRDASPAQFSIWVIDGFFQSAGSGDEVEIILRVSRVAGGVNRRLVRGVWGGDMEGKLVEAAVDLIRTAPPADRPVNRRAEVRQLLARGIERSGIVPEMADAHLYGSRRYNAQMEGSVQGDKLRENLEAGSQLFERVLLLDPDHVEARIYLGMNLADPIMGRYDDARALWWEVYHATNGGMSELAYALIARSHEFEGDLLRAVDHCKRAPEALQASLRFQLQNLEGALLRSESRSGNRQVASLREKLFRDLATFAESPKQSNIQHPTTVLQAYLGHWTGSPVEQAREMDEVLPLCLAAHPELEPYYMASAVPLRGPDENPHLKRLEEILVEAAANPAAIPNPNAYFRSLREIIRWSLQHNSGPIGGHAASAMWAARKQSLVEFTAGDLVMVSFGLSRSQQYEKAIALCETIAAEIVPMAEGGPWGEFPAYVCPPNMIRFYLEKLERPAPIDPLSIPDWGLHFTPEIVTNYAIDGDTFYAVDEQAVSEYDLNKVLLRKTPFPNVDGFLPMQLVLTADSLWLLTRYQGILQMNRADRSFTRQLAPDTFQQGFVTTFHPSEDAIWMGIRRENEGGVAVLDRRSGVVRTLVPDISEDLQRNPGKVVGAPRFPVLALVATGDGSVWVSSVSWGLQRHRPKEGRWESIHTSGNDYSDACLVANEQWVVMGEYSRYLSEEDPAKRKKILCVVSLLTGEKRNFGTADGLPIASVNSAALDGDRLWIGGPGYVAVLDLKSGKVLRRQLINNIIARDIKIQEEHVWINGGSLLFRAARHFPGI